MQPEKVAEVRGWLQKAANDLRGARIDLDADPPFVEDALFHSQQAAEKAMKAFLTAHDVVFRKTHDLDEIASPCESVDASLAEALSPARDLSVFAWVFRYPGHPETPSLAVASQSLATAQRVYNAIAARLPDEVRP